MYPKQHVLLSPVRDANPFFHLLEAIWMLAGRDDGAFIDNYVKNFSERYADNGWVPDAYGYRWRNSLSADQLNIIVVQLRNDPTTRQAVLQMWGAGREDLFTANFKPCNLVAVFRIVKGRLNMVVSNRSNDLIWGCCGSNAVHFAILQEYIAGMVGVPLGGYWQVSSNLHMYMEHHEMLRKRTGVSGFPLIDVGPYLRTDGNYEKTQPLVTDPASFDKELEMTMVFLDRLHHDSYDISMDYHPMKNIFLKEVALNMAIAYKFHRQKNKVDALKRVAMVMAEDWRKAGMEWLERH
jgi:hypothetical protein